MAEVNIVTGISWYYLLNTTGKNCARPFLDSSAVVKSAKVWVLCTDFEPTPELQALYPYVTFVHAPAYQTLIGDKFPTDCFGEWLSVMPWFEDNDIVIQTDADVVIQRDFTRNELHFIPDTRTVCIGMNAGDNDTLADEGKRINVDAGHLKDVPCWNGGNIMASVAMFRRMKDAFDAGWGEYKTTCFHRSRSQLYFCKTLHELPGRTILTMPRTLHAHGHFGMPPGCEVRGDKLFCGDQLVMFRHNL